MKPPCATVAFASCLSKSLLALARAAQMHIPIINAWQLNERHYGGLTGLDKQETVEKHGKDQVMNMSKYRWYTYRSTLCFIRTVVKYRLFSEQLFILYAYGFCRIPGDDG